MDRETRNSAIAAAVIMIGVGAAAYFMPTIMLAVAKVSPLAAGVVAALFVGAYFLIFWLRGRFRKKR